LREANDRDPGNAEARVNLAAGLLQQERAAEALDLLDAADPPPEPRLSGHWRAQRVLALLQLGRPAEARRAIDAIEPAGPGLAPLLLWRRVLLAKQAGDSPEARAFAGEMEAAPRDAGSLTPEHAIMALFDLARFWSGERERQRAFAHWIEGHRLLARFQPFSRQAWREFRSGAGLMESRHN
jgi:tetratricopeptide (TPR) repeat protein